MAHSAALISQDEMDLFLREGSNTDNARLKIIVEYAKRNPELEAFLKETYHHGYGLRIGDGVVSAWAMEDGIHFARGNRVRYVENTQVLPWRDVMRRISQLLDEGRFATNVELAEAPGFERREIAEKMIYLARELTDEARTQGYLSSVRALRGGFPDETEQLAGLLENPETRAPIVEEYRQFVIAWRERNDLLRFRIHPPAVLLRLLNELNEPRREFHSDMAELPATAPFITEDEINDVLQRQLLDYRVKLFQYWQEGHNRTEKANLYRSMFNNSGRSGAVSSNFDSWANFFGKGLELRKAACSDVQLKWSEVVRRIDSLIADGRYVTPEELEQYRAKQQERRQRTEQTEAASIPEAAEAAAVPDAPAEPDYLSPVLHTIDRKQPWTYSADYFREHPAERDRIQYLKTHLQAGVGKVSLEDGTDLWFQAEKNGLTLWTREQASNPLRYSWEDVCRLAAERMGVDSSKETVLQGYAAVKLEHADDIVLYQEGNHFELYGQDAELAAPLLGVELETRPALQGEGTIPYCAIPTGDLEASVQSLRDKYDVTVSGLSGTERRTVSFPSVDHEADRDIDAHEAEYGADGARAFSIPVERETAGDSPAVSPRPSVQSPAAPAAVSAAETRPEAAESAAVMPEWDPLAPPYHVGDTVYLDGIPFDVKAIFNDDVEVYNTKLGNRAVLIRDFERRLYQDSRNSQITDYLGVDLRNYNSNWEGILTGDGGLLGLPDKANVVGWIRAHESNDRIAQRLADGYAGRSGVIAPQPITVNAQSYSTTEIGLELHYQGNHNGTLKFPWIEIACILRTKFQQEREAFYRDPGTEPSVNLTGALHYGKGDTVVVPFPEGEIVGTIEAVSGLNIVIHVEPDGDSVTVNRRRFEEAIRHDERNAGLFLPEDRETVETQENAIESAPAASARPVETVTPSPPSDAVRPSAVDAPSASDRPAAPVRPSAPVQTAAPVRPSTPVQTAAPVRPSAPVQTVSHVRPATPVEAAASSRVSQSDIDAALRRWNGNMDSKRAVVRYMADHARERDTAAWLSREFDGGKAPAFHVETGGSSADIPWARVQRRLAQLIQQQTFFTQEEQDNFEDIDPVAIREELAQHGIVNGELVDPAALENSPFIQQVEADAAQAAAREESAEPSPVDTQPQTVQRMEPVDASEIIRDGAAPEALPVIEVEGVEVPEPPEAQTVTETESAAVPVSPEQPPASYTPQDFQPYKVGDTVWLDRREFEITEIRYSTIQLRDLALDYPLFRAESRERFEQLLQQDLRNGAITDFLPLSPTNHYVDLMDALTGDEGLLNERHKEIIAGWFRAREGNTRIAQRLSDTFAGTRETMLLHTGEWADYFANTIGLELQIQDKYNTKYSFRWYEAAQVLRSLYQDERGGFSHEPKPRETVRLEGRPVYQVGDHVVVPYPDRDVEGTIGYIGQNEVRIDTGPYAWSNVMITVPQFEEALRQDERNADLFVLDVREPVAQPQVQPNVQQENVQPSIQPENVPQENVQPGTIGTEQKPETAAGPESADNMTAAAQTEPADSTEAAETEIKIPAKENFRITDDHLGEGSQREKFRANMNAIYTLKAIEAEGRNATREEQEILSRYVGWGGLPNAFDPDKSAWNQEYQELKAALTDEEYRAANASVLNAHYTSPTVIKAVYEAIENMGFKKGNILEPSCGIGNFLGLLPESMKQSNLFGVELDSITGRIAQQLYPKARILVRGYERTDYPKDFFDLAVGNVPFGNYTVFDPAYSKLNFSIHNYFFAKTLDQVRPGGVVAFVTSRYTMDAQSPEVRRYLAKRAKLLGAIRLPNDAFRANAGTDVVTDILFLQKNDAPVVEEPEWVQTGKTGEGFTVNNYFLRHPEMVLGVPTSESTQYGHQDYTVNSVPGSNLAELLHEAVSLIHGEYREAELPDLGEDEPVQNSIPADPNVRNYSYTLVNGDVYYRENSVMVRPELSRSMEERVKGMVELRDCVHRLIDLQMNGTDTMAIYMEQRKLNKLYDAFTEKYGLLNNRANSAAFSADSAYYLLCSLEVLDEDGNLQRKADMFTKRTIKSHTAVTSVDTPAEALAVSIGERARVDMPYMMRLCGRTEDEIVSELRGVIFFNHESLYDSRQEKYLPADEYLSGNVRRKLAELERAVAMNPDMDFSVNIEAMKQAQPRDLDASEIDVRLGATWVDKRYIQQFMYETFKTSWNDRRHIRVNYSEYTSQWNITEKGYVSGSDVMANFTYGTSRINAYHILEDTLNLRDVRIYDLKRDPDTGKERRVLNLKETMLAQQKQRKRKLRRRIAGGGQI